MEDKKSWKVEGLLQRYIKEKSNQRNTRTKIIKAELNENKEE